jgi:hypothetical protein
MAVKKYMQVWTVDKTAERNFGKFKNSSSNEFSSAAARMMLIIMTVELSNYNYRKFQPIEIFAVLACWS